MKNQMILQSDFKCHARNVASDTIIKPNFRKVVWHKPDGDKGCKLRDVFSYIGDKCQVIYLHHVKADVNQRREEAKVDKWKPALIYSITAQKALVEQKGDADCHYKCCKEMPRFSPADFVR